MISRRNLIAIILGVTLSGCGGDTRAPYIPATGKSRAAVETALNAWKSGAPHGSIAAGDIVINVFDRRWPDGKKLESFEILDEVKGDQPQFNVRIQLSGEPEQTNMYLVIGINPIQVFRDEDYTKAQSM